MLPFLQFLILLAVIITFAKLGGYISLRLLQPAVVGEVLAGLLLGPTALNILHWDVFTNPHLEETFTFLAELGVLLLMFIAGLELHVSDMLKSGKVAVFAGVLGFAVPLGMGYALASIFGNPPNEALFIGLLLAPTSVSISAQTLMELGALRSRVGVSLLGAAVIDDTLVVLGVSVFLAVLGGGEITGLGGIAILITRMLAFLIISFLLGYRLLPRLTRFTEKLPISQGLVAFAFTTMIFYSWTAEVLGGVATIIGAFISGLLFSRTEVKEVILQGFSAIAYGIFVPIFFIDIGLKANLRELNVESIWLLLAMIGVAFISKILSSGLGGLMGGLDRRQSVQLGVSMIPRGEVVLIVAAVGITEGFITQTELSVAVAMVVMTTILTPPILRQIFKPQTIKVEKS